VVFVALPLAASADELLKTHSPLLPSQDVYDILAKKKSNPDFFATPLCPTTSTQPCRVFALPQPSTALSASLHANPLEKYLRDHPLNIPKPPPTLVHSAPLSVACPKDGQFHSCRVVDSLSNINPGEAGLTLYVTGTHSAELSKRAAQGLLTSNDVRGLISEKTIGILPEAVETSAADHAVGILARSGIAKAGRGAAVMGIALMTYAAYQYFFTKDDKPPEPKPAGRSP
jgi:hypothetical protein